MKDRKNKKALFNPTRDEVLAREPLLAFSFYLSDKNNILQDLTDEIVENLDKGFGEPIHTEFLGEASTWTWFWTLGAYEVVRTISQSKDCFSENFMEKIASLKRELAIVRMPSSKMEEAGRKTPVNSNRSPDGWDLSSKDLIIGSPDRPKSARQLFTLYNKTMDSLMPSDVFKSHRESNSYKP